MSVDHVEVLGDADFDEQVNASGVPVVVFFWANGCGPSKMLFPMLHEVVAEHKGGLALAKLNIDDHPETARRFEITSTPTVIVFRDGEPVKRIVGARPKSALEKDVQDGVA